jgi:hypothetical protein
LRHRDLLRKPGLGQPTPARTKIDASILPLMILPSSVFIRTAISRILRSLRKLFSIEFLLPNDLASHDLALSSPSFTSFPSVKSVFIPGCSLWLRLRCPVLRSSMVKSFAPFAPLSVLCVSALNSRSLAKFAD